MPWFQIQLRGVDQGHSWFATNEDEVLQNFVRIKGADLKKEAKKTWSRRCAIPEGLYPDCEGARLIGTKRGAADAQAAYVSISSICIPARACCRASSAAVLALGLRCHCQTRADAFFWRVAIACRRSSSRTFLASVFTSSATGPVSASHFFKSSLMLAIRFTIP